MVSDDEDLEVTAVEADPASAATAQSATPREKVSRRRTGEIGCMVVLPFGPPRG